MSEQNEIPHRAAGDLNPPVKGECKIRIAARPVITLPKYDKTKSVMPQGDYDVRVETAQLRRSKSGHEMIEMELAIEGFRRRFRDYLVFIESCDWKIADFLTAMGKKLVDGMDIDPFDYIGRTARARIGVREFNGRLQNYIEKWLPPENSTPASPNSSSVTAAVDETEAHQQLGS